MSRPQQFRNIVAGELLSGRLEGKAGRARAASAISWGVALPGRNAWEGGQSLRWYTPASQETGQEDNGGVLCS